MAKEQYKDFSFRTGTLGLINIMNSIIEEFQAQGFKLTVRQLYYQLVAQDFIENTEKSYKRITNTVNDARLAGLMDWDAIEDRTREVIARPAWESGRDILHGSASQFHMEMWYNQDVQPLVIVEKEALAGVMERVCWKWDVPLLAARGYPSVTVVRELVELYDLGKPIVVLHLGDHDPSGIDMTRDLKERLELFSRGYVEIQVNRIALNMDQINALKPPPNPAKQTDARFQDYRRKFGDKSWELDALSPSYLSNLVETNLQPLIDTALWEARKKEIQGVKDRLHDLAETF